jgi:hypothetical protein
MADGSKLLQYEVIIVQFGLPPGRTYVFHDRLEAVLISVRGVWVVPSTMFPRASCPYHAGGGHAFPEDELVYLERESLETHVIEQIDIMTPWSRRIRVLPSEAAEEVPRLCCYQ